MVLIKEYLSWDDVLIVPQWSTVRSRADVNVSTQVANTKLGIGLLSSNMDSVTGPEMCKAIDAVGGKGILHRFWSIDDNVAALRKSPSSTWCSVGIGDTEKARAEALVAAGCETLVLDVAMGAAQHVVDQTK